MTLLAKLVGIPVFDPDDGSMLCNVDTECVMGNIGSHNSELRMSHVHILPAHRELKWGDLVMIEGYFSVHSIGHALKASIEAHAIHVLPNDIKTGLASMLGKPHLAPTPS